MVIVSSPGGRFKVVSIKEEGKVFVTVRRRSAYFSKVEIVLMIFSFVIVSPNLTWSWTYFPQAIVNLFDMR